MFQRITSSGRDQSIAPSLNKLNYLYKIYDCDFIQEISIPMRSSEIEPLAAIVNIYAERNLNVPQNLTRYLYKYAICRGRICDIGWLLDKLQEYYPYLNYRTKYHSCTLNQLKKLQFIKCLN